MSFILDALKKSEHERQRQSIPGLVEATMLRPKPRLPMWALALCILLAINLMVLLFVLLRGWMAAPTAAAPTAAATKPAAASPQTRNALRAGTDALAAAAGDRHFSPLDTQTDNAPENPGATPAPAPAAQPPPPVRARVATSGASGERVIRRRDPLLDDDNTKSNDDEVLPSINELNLAGAQALPELHLDVHVFATRASDRFVFINMRKYHEGAAMQEGPTVERIRRDGVILDYQGLRFLLPRQ